MENNSIEIEYMDIMARSAWPMIYQRIGQLCQEFPYTFIEAKKPQNKPLNRYRDVNPYDHSRVILKRCDRDYINANYVKLDRANRRYILTQGPLAFTVGHFWLMVWEQKSKAILMLNKVIEKNEMKCQWYWPQAIGEQHKIVLNDVNLTVEQTHEEDCSYYSTRTFRLVDLETSTSRVVVQYHYTTWPDFGVPTSPVAFLTFLKRVRQSGVLDSDVGPPIIHCSAGIGRSGTFCLVDSCLVIIEKEGVDNVDIQQILLTLRRDRMGLIQTPDQLRFSYQAIIEGIKRLDPDFKEEEEEEEAEKEPANIDENIYNDVAEEEEAPPPPPPRSESLTRAPAGPLPAIPTSESLGNLDLSRQQEDSSSSDEESPSQSAMESAVSASSTEGEDETYQSPADSLVAAENRETLRRRRTRELAERVSAIKRRAREAERWHALKRSLHKPLTITFGFILAGIIIYSYIKH